MNDVRDVTDIICDEENSIDLNLKESLMLWSLVLTILVVKLVKPK